MSNIMQCCRPFVFKNYFYPLSLVVFTLCLFSSCRISKPTAYFKTLNRDTAINHFVDSNIESKIVKNDLLSISVSSLNRLEDELYNVSSLSSSTSSGSTLGSGASSGSTSTSHGQGYTVDLDGNIQIHNLGKVHVEGLTRKQLKDTLEISLLPYLKDPIVTIGFLNRRITVLGEVLRPQVIELQQEQMSLLDAIAITTDVTANALKNNILIIRETPNGKIFKHINLEDESIFTNSSPWYNLQSGDIVYVEPDIKKITRLQRIVRDQQIVSFTLAAASLALIIFEISRQ
jgi:polysaccharide export outer membrane protein